MIKCDYCKKFHPEEFMISVMGDRGNFNYCSKSCMKKHEEILEDNNEK